MNGNMGYCVVCGKKAKHHHNYCDKHYPKQHHERHIIKQLKERIATQNKEIRELKNKIRMMRR